MKSMNFFYGLMAVVLIGVTACDMRPKDSAEVAKDANDEAKDDRKDEKDADFVVNTIASSYCEIKLAQLALNRSSDVSVKNMAKMLETEHEKVIMQLKAYAGKNGISVPLEETDKHKRDINSLAGERDGEKFDEKWREQLKDSHQQSIDNFESRLEKTEDVELQNWITATLPKLRSHLNMLDEATSMN